MTPDQWADLHREADAIAASLPTETKNRMAAAVIVAAMASRTTLTDQYRKQTIGVLHDLAPSLARSLRLLLALGDRHHLRKKSAS